MSDGISDGHRMTEDSARETLYLLEILRILFEDQNEGGKFSPALETLAMLKKREEHTTHLPETRLEDARQEAERLTWTEADLDGNEDKESAWAQLIWNLLEEGVFRTTSLFEPISEISLIGIEHILDYGDITGDQKLLPRGNKELFNLRMARFEKEKIASIGRGDRHFLLVYFDNSFNLYTF
jgi:hypothetical protein